MLFLSRVPSRELEKLMKSESIRREQAIEMAKAEARKAYSKVDLNSLQLSVVETAAEWKIEFTNTGSLADGESQHFSVWVDKSSGTARLFKGR